MRQLIKRKIGQILLDGRFMSNRDLDQALEEQKNTKELLGHVLVRMGVVKEQDFKVPLKIQKHLCHIDDAVKIAAGERELLGVLLVHSGHITKEQLDYAIDVQKSSGDKLGEVFIRLGMLQERQLTALLDFQKHQSEAARNPLRLGELLVATGHVSRKQLNDAIRKQTVSHKRIGEVLVDEGYVRPSQVKYGICLQKMLVGSVLAGIISLGSSGRGYASSATLQWDPSAGTDVTGYKLYSATDTSPLQGSVPLDVKNVTSATVSGLDPSKSYNFAVTAYNASGTESSFSNIVYLAEQTAPTVAIASPASSINVSGVVLMSVNASDNVGVTKVEFYVNGVLMASDTAAPYVYSWDTTPLAAGSYTLMAKAYDAAGNVGQSAISTVTVVKDVTPPTVAVTSPVNNAIVSGIVTINSSASDNVGVSTVEFYANGAFLYASNMSPYSYSWDTQGVANGTYSIVSKAYDNAGNSAQSTPVAVTVNNVGDITAPVVALSSPVANATVSGTVAISATASDNVGVSRVEYYVNGILNGTSTVSPYTFNWNTTAVANGPYTLNAKAYDAAGNVGQSAAVTVNVSNLAIQTGTALSAWSATTVPGVIDSGPDAAVELGVKFRSDVDSSITGIRFYKAGTNTGTHTGSLWSSSGKLLATATFTNETASGWQQVNFATPVAIAANTVYVASYHTNAGHYSDDQNYFAGKGVDNGPLHLLADGVSGPSGVYAYGTSSIYPSLGWNSSNYWVDVVSISSSTTTVPTPDVTAPTLTGFTLPATSTTLTVPVSGFTASDNIAVAGYLITENPTTPAAGAAGWSSAAPASFTFSSAGAKTAYAWAKDAAGNVSASRSASVTITLPDVTAPTLTGFTIPATSTSLTVPVSGLTASDNIAVAGYLITESSTTPAAGAAGWSSAAPSSFTFSSAGFKTAYAWAKDAAGNVSPSRSATVTITLPDVTAPVVAITNLAANSTVSGTVSISAAASDNVGVTRVEFYVNGILSASVTTYPYTFSWNTAAVANGSYTLNAKAYDAAGNVGQSTAVTVNVSNLAIKAGTTLSAWSAATVPAVIDSGPDAAVELGVKFRSDVKGKITGIRFYKAGTNTGTHTGSLWSSSGKLLATATFTNETASGWQQVSFATPVSIAANTVYVASYHTNTGHYSEDQFYFSGKGVDNSSLHLIADGVSGPSGVYSYGTSSNFPSQGWNASNYWVDVVFK